MLRRVISVVLLAWVLGFVAFAVALPRPAGTEHTDAVVVLTGGEGRIDRGLEVLRAGWAGRMLVAGVDPEVRASEFAVQYRASAGLMACCVSLGYESVDTRSNAEETTRWVAAHQIGSIRLVTSDWHMRRALFELHRRLPKGVRVVADAVPTRPSFNMLLTEYSKFLVRQLVPAGAA
ncbi:MAG: YdcF family protein [Proteobacteria bacterium]|nr:YdcF family protein [Pseudomonadota bacterium]